MNALHLAGAATDIGKKRQNNEDSWIIGEEFFAVADGMGGAAAGQIASKTALEGLNDSLLSFQGENLHEALKKAIRDSHERINQTALAFPEYKGMGSTLTAVLLANNIAYLAQVGDSRAYLIRNKQIRQLTSDQTVTADLIRKGRLTAFDALTHPKRHVLTQAMGAGRKQPVLMLDTISVFENDYLILCTDGLYNMVSDEEIRDIAVADDPQAAAVRLVQLANNRGGTDNITVIVVRI